MTKKAWFPLAAVLCGWIGFLLRKRELSTGFEDFTGLPVPQSAARTMLALFTVCVVVVFFYFSRHKYTILKGYDQTFYAPKLPYIFLTVLGALLLFLSGVWNVYLFYSGQSTLLPPVFLGFLCIVSSVCVIFSGKSNYGGKRRGQYSLALLIPAYTACLWLITTYQVYAGDPVRADYIYKLLAIIAVLLALYAAPAFSFDRGSVTCTLLSHAGGIYFSILVLADGHSPGDTLRYLFGICCLLANMYAVLGNLEKTSEELLQPLEK